MKPVVGHTVKFFLSVYIQKHTGTQKITIKWVDFIFRFFMDTLYMTDSFGSSPIIKNILLLHLV